MTLIHLFYEINGCFFVLKIYNIKGVGVRCNQGRGQISKINKKKLIDKKEDSKSSQFISLLQL
jgi:hypothetical protein